MVIDAEQVLDALRLWHGGDTNKWPLANLRLGLQLINQSEDFGTLAEAGPAAVNRAILSQGLAQMKLAAPESEELLRERFEHRRDVLTLANRLNISESSLYYRQRQAINQLTDILVELEDEASTDWRERMENRLGIPSYEKLVGIDQPKNKLIDALANEQEHFIVSIDGLGGLGKTAMADHITRTFIQTTRFDEIAWVTAKHTHLSMLGRLQIESGRPSLTLPLLIEKLKSQFELGERSNLTQIQAQRLVKKFLQERRCLIVIDNLETVADYRTLLPELRKWQGPSKFLITSRIRLMAEPGVFSLSLTELDEDAAKSLIRQEAQRIGFTDLAAAAEKELQKIYNAVGGNPLALKLIVGQLRFHSLSRVLDRFANTRQTGTNEGLFDYIYREIWETLADDRKTILVTLTQAGETGFTMDHLINVSGLSETILDAGLTDLVLSSLVDITGNLFERRYRLHRLTELFLLRMLEE